VGLTRGAAVTGTRGAVSLPGVQVLVTGAAGFIGSHLVDALLARGDDVAIVDHLRRSPRPWVADALRNGARLHVADVRDLDKLRDAFGAARPEVVMHLAAQVDVRRSVADPAYDVQVNVAGTVSVLEAARSVEARRILFASTAAAYGNPNRVPTGEDAPLSPLSPYGTSKAAAEWYLDQYARLHGLSTLSLRMANVYGPRQDPQGEAGVVAIFAGASVGGQTVTVFGDGRQTRDYVYVGDVVDAWLMAAESNANGALNLSTGAEVSVLDLVGELGLAHTLAPARVGEVARSCLDPSAAERVLGWRARVDLAEGLRRTLAAVDATPTPASG
jgi:UDP-glucose 4-epimerase